MFLAQVTAQKSDPGTELPRTTRLAEVLGVTWYDDRLVEQPMTSAGIDALDAAECLLDYLNLRQRGVRAGIKVSVDGEKRLVLFFGRPIKVTIPRRYMGYAIILRTKKEYDNHAVPYYRHQVYRK